MRNAIALLLLLIFSSVAEATTYYISPSGSDSNNGTSSGTPWLTPHHAVNCGDVISAAAGTYDEANFRLGNWGVVTCAAANNVAWLKCATFDTCKITISTAGHDALGISQSYWGVQGWEVTVSTPSTNQCFQAYPPDGSTPIHNIIFANNIANGCGDGGFTNGASAAAVGVDDIAIVGNIVYDSAQDNTECYSGIDLINLNPANAAPGTHAYVAGNFVWGVVDPNPCAGGLPTDGQGISLDTDDPYNEQIVVTNNISVFNGASGFQTFDTNVAHSYISHNTVYGNEKGSINANPCGEVNVNTSAQTQIFMNLVESDTSTACHATIAHYALSSSFDAATDIFYNNFIYSAAGNNTIGNLAVFLNNTSGTDPVFANPVEPSAPSCGSFASVPACMAMVIANFTPTTVAAKPFGYQIPLSVPVYDPLFPQWLCSVTNLPAGLVTMGCLTGSGTSGSSVSGGSISQILPPTNLVARVAR